MKLRLLLLIGFLPTILQAQDIPLFSQKLTNSFIFNPALAGHSFGSLTYSFKQNYSGVQGAPQNHFLSIHTPIANHRFGIGANIYQEDVNFLRNAYSSIAFAYHIPLSKISSLSFGVSGEYNSLTNNGTTNFTGTIPDPEYERLIASGVKDFDFSFGMHFQNQYIKAGIAANRLSTSWIKEKNSVVLSNYYSGFIQALLPMRGGEDLLEPFIAYRKLSPTNSILDLGMFYTLASKLTLGASLRSGQVLNGTIAYKLNKMLTVGYSREMIAGNVGGFVGSANEFTVRLDFAENNYKERFRADYKSSVAYRRKTLSSPVRRPGSKSPSQMRKNQKKLAPYSPNSRYQNIKKAGMKTTSLKSPTRKKSFSNKKRKPAARKPVKRKSPTKKRR